VSQRVDPSQPLAVVVEGLEVALATGGRVVAGVDFVARSGEVLGIAGESGSGKPTTVLALLGHFAPGLEMVGGRIYIGGRLLNGLSERHLRSLRGRLISYVPQDPASALNPSMNIAGIVSEPLRSQSAVSRETRHVAVSSALRAVDLPDTPRFLRLYPHQLSGGQQQRVAIAMAMVREPAVLVLDEPTTGLDVITQSSVLGAVERLADRTGVAIIYVTHDLSVLSEVADRVMIMYCGQVVEEGPVADVLRNPRHPYSRGLARALPDLHHPGTLRGIPGTAAGPTERSIGCVFVERCDLAVPQCSTVRPALEVLDGGHLVRCTEVHRLAPTLELSEVNRDSSASERDLLAVNAISVRYPTRAQPLIALRAVSLSVRSHEVVAVVGQSGSGKTTLARAIVGLTPPSDGEIVFDNQVLSRLTRRRTPQQLRDIQFVFQNPYLALNPRRRVRSVVARPAQLLRALSKRDAYREADALLDLVRVPQALRDRYPWQISGGERQRIAIAQALATRPRLLVCDEITSALDVSVQAAIVELLRDLQHRLGTALLFVSHDLGLVANIATRIVVLHNGEVVEEGPSSQVLEDPQDAYTKELIASAPSASQTASPEVPGEGRTTR